MGTNLEAHEMPLHRVFSSEHSFSIPDYQRPYSWDEEQALQLLDDLEEAIDRGDEDPYFLGSLVLIKAPNSPAADVVDGQQRLTTLTILFAVLRDLAEQADVRSSIEKMILEPGDTLQGLSAKPRLALRPKDVEFFSTFIQATGTIPTLDGMKKDDTNLSNDPRRLMRRNALALAARLQEWDEARRQQLAAFLSVRTYLVVVTTPSLDSAHRIFSVMNARGLDLEPSDIFKANVIGKVPEALRSEYATRWEDAEESLGRQAFSDLFLHLRMIHSKLRARRELLREFPEQVLTKYLPDGATEFIDDELVPYAKAYGIIEDRSYTSTDDAGQVNAWFSRLRQLDNNDWRPPALWAVRHHGDDPVWLEEFLARLERLAASMFIRRIYTTPRVTRFAELLKELELGDGLESPSLALTAEEQLDTIKRLDGEIYLVAKTRRYILERIDEALAKAPGVSYTHKVVTVEHVLPQNPATDSPWLDLFTEDERTFWTHRLANLALLNRVKNPAAGRKPFNEKKDTYFTSPSGVATFALTVQVLNEPAWNPDVLTARQQKLIGIASDLWALADSPNGAAE